MLDPRNQARQNADVCAVIVTYNPDRAFAQNMRALYPQVGKMIIVDNRSAAASYSLIVETAAVCDAEIVWNQENRGIAAALNIGIKRALFSGQYSWVATFDQDSEASTGYCDAMYAALSACPFRDQVAIVGANCSEPMHKAREGPVTHQYVYREIKSTITSGSFVRTRVFAICGVFDESLFMDYVDHEFCLRVRKYGFKVIQAGGALLAHRLGSPTFHRFFGRRFVTSNHDASRRYFNARNRLIVYRRYLGSEIGWILKDAFGWTKEMIKVVLVERNRGEKLMNVAKGVWDAMRELFATEKSGGR